MNRKLLYSLLTAEAILCVIFCISSLSASSIMIAAMAFPFSQLGNALRILSLSGALWNGIALTIYVGICLLPTLWMLRLIMKNAFQPEDSLLGILTATLFIVLYLMVNPASFRSFFPILNAFSDDLADQLLFCKALCGSMIWSLITGYLILHMLRLFSHSKQELVWNYLEKFLAILSAIFVLIIFGSCLSELVSSISSLREGNINSGSLWPSYVFLSLRFFVDSFSWAMNIFVIHYILCFIAARKKDPYAQETLSAADRLCHFCMRALSAVIISNLLYQILQLLFASLLRDIHSTVSFPIISICFVLVVLLFTRILEENRQLKTDNDLFI